jgi:nucleoside-diphosphate-sugar epimerase
MDASATAPILVTGGTGALGRLVVPRLRAAHQPAEPGRRTWEEFLAGRLN